METLLAFKVYLYTFFVLIHILKHDMVTYIGNPDYKKIYFNYINLF